MISAAPPSPEQLAIYNSGRLEIIDGGFYSIFAHRYSRVVSYANAYGLMQLLPSVGKQLAREEGISHFETFQLLDPAP